MARSGSPREPVRQYRAPTPKQEAVGKAAIGKKTGEFISCCGDPKSLPLIPYYRPGDLALAKAVSERAAKHHAVLLSNHGPVVSGATLEAAGNAIEELEETAKLFLMLRHEPLRCLTEAQVREVHAHFPS
jgi:hypothetical protein